MVGGRELDRAAWIGLVSDFLQCDAQSWFDSLMSFHQLRFADQVQESQQTAWLNSFGVLKSGLAELVDQDHNASRATLIFEYMLPREGGRRPDVLLLTGDKVVVIEFKDFAKPLQAHVDQVAAYVRDLKHYHEATHSRDVVALLVMTLSRGIDAMEDQVHIVDPSALGRALASHTRNDAVDPIDPVEWLNADYAPLPSLVQAARTIFEHEPLPRIRRAASAGIPETVGALMQIAVTAESTGSRHLALVTGVPGAGKTLVGLQFVYSTHSETQTESPSAVFLSGNAPLVSVLQHALKSRVFVQDVHRFLEQYGGSTYRKPREHIWVYDEAQRA